jgi:hypothetical protein
MASNNKKLGANGGGQQHVCRKCSAKFASKQALMQHIQASNHGVGSSRPGANGGGIQMKGGQSKITVSRANKSGQQWQTRSTGSMNKLNKLYAGMPQYEQTLAWAARAVHPCDEKRTGALPIPDKTARTTCCPEYRFDTTLSAPAAFVGPDGKPVATNKWDCAIQCPDLIEAAAIVFMKPTEITWDNWANNYIHRGDNAEWLPQALRFVQFPEGTSIAGVAEAWRVTHRGMTVHMDAPSINNVGMVYAQRWPEAWELVDHTIGSGETATQLPIAVAKTGPWLPRDMIARAGNTYETNAIQNCYTVMFPAQQFDVVPYQAQAEWAQQNAATKAKTGWVNGADGGGVVYPFPHISNLAAFATSVNGVQTFGYQGGWESGLQYWTGLAGAANAANTAAPVANLVIKVRQGVELVPIASGPLSPFSVSPVPYNPAAIDFVTHVAQSAAMSYPGNYNDLGKIWGAIKSGLKQYGMPIADAVANSGIPIVSDVAKIGQGIASFFGF